MRNEKDFVFLESGSDESGPLSQRVFLHQLAPFFPLDFGELHYIRIRLYFGHVRDSGSG